MILTPALYPVLGQITTSGSIEGNWFVGLAFLVTGFLIVWTMSDFKKKLNDVLNLAIKNDRDIAVIKTVLKIKEMDDDDLIKWKKS